MNVFRSVGVETIAPDAHAPEGLSRVLTSCGAFPGAVT